jgi:tripartite-type tricarboxylate transporter receptor subunit TctC
MISIRQHLAFHHASSPTRDMPTRRKVLGLAAGGGFALSGLRARADESWPRRSVRLISPYGPGGSNDTSLRILAERLENRFNQRFIVENRSGAGTLIGNEAAAHATPDGYTFLYAAAPYATAEAMYGKLNYDPRKDLKPISLAVIAPVFLIVNAEAPYKTLKEFIAYAKGLPNGVTFASPGAGSGPHLAAELLFREADIKGLNVAFRGDSTAYTELLAGRVDATLTAITVALPHIRAGKLRVLGVASRDRTSLYPEAPTLVEQGYPNVVGSAWFGFMAPTGTPDTILNTFQEAVNKALAEPDVKEKIQIQGLEPRGTSPAEFGKFIEDETAKWAPIIRNAGLQMKP